MICVCVCVSVSTNECVFLRAHHVPNNGDFSHDGLYANLNEKGYVQNKILLFFWNLMNFKTAKKIFKAQNGFEYFHIKMHIQMRRKRKS